MSSIEISTNVLHALLQDISDLKNRVAILETNHIPAKQPQKERSNSFWDAYNKINNQDNQPFNHANNTDYEIAINLPELIQHCYTKNIDLPPKKQLIRQLKRERSYLGYLVVRSRLKGHAVRCYVFKRS